MVTLSQGANAPLPTKDLDVVVHFGGKADVSSFRLFGNGKTRADSDFVFYNQTVNDDRTVELNNAEQQRKVFKLRLGQLKPDVEKLAFSMTVEQGTISNLQHVDLMVMDGANQLISAKVPMQDRIEKALILCEVYKRNGEWKIRFISQGFNGGLYPLAKHYGAEVSVPTRRAERPQVSVQRRPESSRTTQNVQVQQPVVTVDTKQRMERDTSFSSREQHRGSALMSFWERTKAKFNETSESLQTSLKKFQNKEMLNAIVGGAVYVSAADGDISSDEKQKLMGFLERSEELKVFETGEVIKVFKSLADNFDFDVDVGRGECMKHIVKIKGDESQSQLLIQVVVAIAKSDGDFDDDEKAAVDAIAKALGIQL